ncbi:NAD(P)-binding protein [Mytilinidion resinicola]|uniref:NAD(P)-binding protein n=1 Tax=Mytilinidion resinicola TaxID=574789 RepID=A0A6A6YCF1_9PEZI|nr:NAD(P)-binding protein [Mytilinidion resinicola]KAF2805517.1 NAD(P)-binding protein [Mytilinidion resinicola]
MRVAIAGSGDVARYFAEELVATGIDVIVLGRSAKPYFENLPGIQQVVTDYSVPSLVQALEGCTTLISTILEYTPTFTDVHLKLIEACKQSATIKRFIPSEYGGNIEEFPDQPAFYAVTRAPIRQALKDQDELEWTTIACGWLVDYVVPSRNRWMKEIGDVFAIDLAGKKIVIPGTGKEPLDFTSVRDLAKAVVKLVQTPNWVRYTYISGEKSSWNDLAALILDKYPDMSVEYRSLAKLEDTFQNGPDEMTRLIAAYQIFSLSESGSLPPAKVAAHRQQFFQGIKFRTPRDLVEEVEQHPDIIV